MYPTSAFQNITNGGRIDAIFSCKAVAVGFTGVIAAANLKHLTLYEYGSSVPFTYPSASLFNHILLVLLISTKEKMTRTNTGRVVACMADKQIVGYWTIGEFVREPMGANACFPFRNMSVAIFIAGTCPNPASFSFQDISPQTRLKRHALGGCIAGPVAKLFIKRAIRKEFSIAVSTRVKNEAGTRVNIGVQIGTSQTGFGMPRSRTFARCGSIYASDYNMEGITQDASS